MKKSLLFLVLIIFFIDARSQQSVQQHPDKGILPFNAPCTSCIEEIDKRSANSREFYSYNSDGSKSIFMQKSLGNINFQDKDGFWRAKDPRLIQESEKIYAARMQPYPVVIDFENKFASIFSGKNELRFNKNISLVRIAADGSETSLGAGDWSRITRTENYAETIFLVEEFYPGVDLQMITNAGSVKTSFILKNKLTLDAGWLAMRQELVLPTGYTTDVSYSSPVNETMRAGVLNIVNEAQEMRFTFNRSHAFDAKDRTENFMEMPFTLEANLLDYNVPVSWLENPATVYPVTIDPFVTSSDTAYQAAIIGSGFTPVCGTQGCSYFLDSMMTPPNCKITKISTGFSYLASLPCLRDEGGFDITMFNPNGDSCTTQNFSCPGSIQGACFFWPAQIYDWNFAQQPLGPCLLPPQCAPYPLDFKMMFRRCNWLPIAGCDNTCIASNSDWMMIIEGRTAELTNQSAPQTICDTGCAVLEIAADWGVPPYSVTWNPGGLTGNPVTVCPDSTTLYTAIVSDACEVFDTTSIDVTVVNCTGISEADEIISSIIPNPASNNITIHFSDGVNEKSIVLVNAVGEIILHKERIIRDELILDVSDFSKGIYFLKTTNGSRTSSHKIIIL